MWSYLGQVGRLVEAEQAIVTAEQYLADFPVYADRQPLLLINRADIVGRLGRYADMLRYAQAADVAATRFRQPFNRVKALINQAFAAMLLGNDALASAALREAQALAAEEESPELLGRATINLARLATAHGQLFDALHLLQQARTHFQAAGIEMDLATVAIEEAALAERLCLFYEALSAARRAAGEFLRAELPSESVEASVLAAQIALRLGRPREAHQDLAHAAALIAQTTVRPDLRQLHAATAARPAFHRTRASQASALIQVDTVTQTLYQQGLREEPLRTALVAADLAAALGQADAAERYQALATAAQEAGLPDLEQTAWIGLAGRVRPAQAVGYLERAVAIAEQLRRQMPVEELKAHYLGGQSVLYSRLITAQLAQRQRQAAATTLLRAKGGIWADLAAPADPPSAQTDWLQTKAQLQLWQDQLDPLGDPTYQAKIRAQIDQTTRTLTTVARTSGRQRSPQPLPPLTEVQQRLPPDALGVELLVGERQVRACLLKASGPPHWVTLAPVGQIKLLLDRLRLLHATIQQAPNTEQRLQMARAQLAAAEQVLAELGHLLIKPLGLDASIRQLLLAPDGLLFDVPWAALPTSEGPLGQLYTLAFQPSLALLALPHSLPSSAPPLALGYAGHPPLTHLTDELSSFQRAFPDARIIVPARLADLHWEIPPRLLHIAAHGHLRSRDPLLSQLDFADGAFLLGDALTLRLEGTELVTLSACETGTVPERGGVSLALAGAFLTAGAQQVLAGLWKVDDVATTRFMDALYTALSRGINAPEAVRAAQIMLCEEGYSHPYYWAAFQLLLRGVGSTEQ